MVGKICKIADFGITRRFEETKLSYTEFGTRSYMAPEIYSSQGYNLSSDIWALGCVLYYLLCLKHPFKRKNQSILDLQK